ncbi:hypothetical protein EPUL_003707 [Erysiphe pulchra]|uniref:Uncharacterized protein n=1 Tax=Erysiphe pulchra TaxID=225359 RepID=A0A2S4PVZ6_9PEZI|nr:hypothetical protein EPUL_003707 [Erysiphe pulchra]
MPLVDLFISWLLLSNVVSTYTVLDRRELKENGYECGGQFFNDQMVNDALKVALSEEGRGQTLPYSGLLYRNAKNYLLWPILPKGTKRAPSESIWQRSVYRIVIDNNGKIVDLIVWLANMQFAKCWRVDTQRSEASIYNVEGSNGYECGSEFIPDSTITERLVIARENLDKSNDSPPQYRGNLYSEDLGYKIWPIYQEEVLAPHQSGNPQFRMARTPETFLMVIESTGRLRDVVARTLANNHIRCMRTRKPSFIEQLLQTLDKTPTTGYLCNNAYYDDSYLLDESKNVKNQAMGNPKISLRHHNGAPFRSPCILWPLKKYVPSFTAPGRNRHFLALALDYSAMYVVIGDGPNLIPCQKVYIPGGNSRNIYQIKSDFILHKEPESSTRNARQRNTSP